MSNPLDVFCGHCGDRLPRYGGKLGFCPDCARRYKGVLRDKDAMSPPPLPYSPNRSVVTGTSLAKDPLLASVLSGLFPGGGQVYNGHFLKAVLIFCTSPFVIPWLIGIVDAFFSARRLNERRMEQQLIGAQAA